jgi:hypothetical protein
LKRSHAEAASLAVATPGNLKGVGLGNGKGKMKDDSELKGKPGKGKGSQALVGGGTACGGAGAVGSGGASPSGRATSNPVSAGDVELLRTCWNVEGAREAYARWWVHE